MGRTRDYKRNSNQNSRHHHHKKHQHFKEKKPHFTAAKRQFNADNKPKIPIASLKEDQVGITEYLNAGPGFTGVIKARFSDFHVNEIDLDGNEIQLTDLKVPQAEKDSLGEEALAKNKKELEGILTDEIWRKIETLLQDESKEKVSVSIDVTNSDKTQRTLIHKTLKEEFGSAIVSTTTSVGDEKFIQCLKSKGNGRDTRNRWLWPGEYVYFVVHKENADTVRAAADLARNLRLRSSMVNYAGTKDKRAKTTQLFCVKKREPQSIAQAAHYLKYLKVGNFSFQEKVLKLGELKGNRFRIAIRHIEGDEQEIEKSLENMKTNGFINYYGLQRFGNSASIPTYEVGVALLKSDYKEACELILKPREGEPHFLKEIREFWWKTRKSGEAAARFRDDKYIEKKLLDGLDHFGENDYANALRKIPRNMLLLYTHSYQSLIWNRIASRRIKEFGLKVIPGDLVFTEKATDVDLVDAVETDCMEETPMDVEDETEQNVESQFKTMVQAVMEEDISSNKYSIFDIVLPLPGYDITYPSNDVAKWYEEILSERGLTSDKLKHNVKTYSLTGAYRKLLVKPENMQWSFKRYDSPTSNLIASDFEKLQGNEADADVADGKFRALILDFVLPSSAYATMALREMLKCDTSASNQQMLTEQLLKEAEEKDSKGTSEVELNTELLEGDDNGEEVGETKPDEAESKGVGEDESKENSVEVEGESSSKRKADDEAENRVKKAKPE